MSEGGSVFPAGPGRIDHGGHPALAGGTVESWLTVSAVLAHDAAVGCRRAPDRHRAQGMLRRRRPSRSGAALSPGSGVVRRVRKAAPDRRDRRAGPRLDLWRAPTDNDRGDYSEKPPLEPTWRAAGLHRTRPTGWSKPLAVNEHSVGRTGWRRPAPTAGC